MRKKFITSLTFCLLQFFGHEPANAGEWQLRDQYCKTIFEAHCYKIEYCGGGIYSVWQTSQGPSKLINQNGKPIQLKLPNGLTILNAYISPKNYDKTVEGSKLPDDTWLEVSSETTSKPGLRGLVDLNGNVIVPLEYNKIGYADSWHYNLFKNDNQGAEKVVGVYDVCSKSVIPTDKIYPGKGPRNSDAQLHPFREIGTENGNWGYRTERQIVIPPQFASAEEFHGKYAIVRQKDGSDYSSFFIDKTGKAVSPKFSQLHEFHGGYAIFVQEARTRTPTLFRMFVG